MSSCEESGDIVREAMLGVKRENIDCAESIVAAVYHTYEESLTLFLATEMVYRHIAVALAQQHAIDLGPSGIQLPTSMPQACIPWKTQQCPF